MTQSGQSEIEIRSAAIFPTLAHAAGRYESFYVKLNDPRAPVGAWIRHTVHKRPGHEPTASVWFTLFDGASSDGPVAAKVTVGADQLGAPDGGMIRIADSVLAPGRLRGSALEASWDLTFTPGAPELRHLPAPEMYTSELPRTKALTPHPSSTFDGRIQVGARTLEVDGWLGMLGHNWGSEHAARRMWLHGIDFDAAPGAWLDVVAARVRSDEGELAPWAAAGALCIDGQRHALLGIDGVEGARIADRHTSCEFLLRGAGIEVEGKVSAPARNFVAWLYRSPNGEAQHTLNCSIADMTLVVRRDGEPDLELASNDRCGYEIGVVETDHGIPVQRFDDG